MAIAVWLISGLSISTDYGDLWLPTAMMGFGVGFALTPMNLAAMNAVRREHAGAASGILVTLSGLGATLGVAITGAIFNSLNADNTVTEVAKTGVTVSHDQAQQPRRRPRRGGRRDEDAARDRRQRRRPRSSRRCAQASSTRSAPA